MPSPNTDFVAVAAGSYYSLGLKTDGSIISWGRNYYGQCDVPAPNTGYVAVAAGAHHSLGLFDVLTPVPEQAVTALRLSPNQPNPFNPSTTIAFEVPVAGSALLQVFDLRGRLVRTLVDESLPAGRHEARWDGRDADGRELPSAVYLSRLEAGGKVALGRMTLVR